MGRGGRGKFGEGRGGEGDEQMSDRDGGQADSFHAAICVC